MLPYWIDLSVSELVQGTAVLATLITLLSFRFLLPTGRV